MRFQAYGWEVIEVADGNSDLEGIYNSIMKAKTSDKPTMIKVKTIIGFGAEQQNTATIHGTPLGDAQIEKLKKHFGLPAENFYISEQTRQIFNNTKVANLQLYA